MKIGKIFLIMIAISMIMIATTTAANIGNEEKPEPVNTSEIGYFVSGINPYGEIEGAERLGNEKKPEAERIGNEKKPEAERIGNEEEPNAEKPDLTPESTPSPTPTVDETKMPEPVANQTVDETVNETKPTPELTPSPEPTPTIAPTPEPTPSPTITPTPEPIPSPTPAINKTDDNEINESEDETVTPPIINETVNNTNNKTVNGNETMEPVNQTVNETAKRTRMGGGRWVSTDWFLKEINKRCINTNASQKNGWTKWKYGLNYTMSPANTNTQYEILLHIKEEQVKAVSFKDQWEHKERIPYRVANEALKNLRYGPCVAESVPIEQIELKRSEEIAKPLTIVPKISEMPEKITVTIPEIMMVRALKMAIVIVVLGSMTIVTAIIILVKKRKNKDQSR